MLAGFYHKSDLPENVKILLGQLKNRLATIYEACDLLEQNPLGWAMKNYTLLEGYKKIAKIVEIWKDHYNFAKPPETIKATSEQQMHELIHEPLDMNRLTAPTYTKEEVVACVREFLINHRKPRDASASHVAKHALGRLTSKDWMILGVLNLALNKDEINMAVNTQFNVNFPYPSFNITENPERLP